jgi:hypothetical protein
MLTTRLLSEPIASRYILCVFVRFGGLLVVTVVGRRRAASLRCSKRFLKLANSNSPTNYQAYETFGHSHRYYRPQDDYLRD